MTTNYLEVADPRLERADLIAWLLEQGSARRTSTIPSRRCFFQPAASSVTTAATSRPVRSAISPVSRSTSCSATNTLSACPWWMTQTHHSSCDPTATSPPTSNGFSTTESTPTSCSQSSASWPKGCPTAPRMMRSAVLGAVLRPGATELEVAKSSQLLADSVAPMLGPMIQDMLFLQLRHAAETEAVNASERAEGLRCRGPRRRRHSPTRRDSPAWEELPPEDLEAMSNRLADLARDAAVAPVRFVKTIGDAVMFVSPDPAALLEAVLNPTEAAEADELLPRLRAGITYGSAVSRRRLVRQPDQPGQPCHLDSALDSVLVSEDAREQIGDDERFRWSFAGEKELRGIDHEVNLFRARRADAGEESD